MFTTFTPEPLTDRDVDICTQAFGHGHSFTVIDAPNTIGLCSLWTSDQWSNFRLKFAMMPAGDLRDCWDAAQSYSADDQNNQYYRLIMTWVIETGCSVEFTDDRDYRQNKLREHLERLL